MVAIPANVEFQNVHVSYHGRPALRDISLSMPANKIFGIIGPANSGKTTLLKCINRMIDLVDGAEVGGRVLVAQEDVRKFATSTTSAAALEWCFRCPSASR